MRDRIRLSAIRNKHSRCCFDIVADTRLRMQQCTTSPRVVQGPPAHRFSQYTGNPVAERIRLLVEGSSMNRVVGDMGFAAFGDVVAGHRQDFVAADAVAERQQEFIELLDVYGYASSAPDSACRR